MNKSRNFLEHTIKKFKFKVLWIKERLEVEINNETENFVGIRLLKEGGKSRFEKKEKK
jgi:hypothetical protein